MSEEPITRTFLTFSLADESYAIDIHWVREVLAYQKVTRVPRAPDILSGVINIRGKVIPVIDLRQNLRLGESKTPGQSTSIIVLEINLEETLSMGIIVDDVHEVIEIENAQIQSTQNIRNFQDTMVVKEIAKEDDNLIMILDLEGLLDRDSLTVIAGYENESHRESGHLTGSTASV
ncbi:MULTISPECIES: chemotaxis protein CheW [Sediminispirochaeta]|uniref:CheW protein n=1 Tax=Sediminispirochaeta smaragdinae (strain DSM 11293 / JCM 15392 / SEBR 4228) TaxID=573413 RepID=E1R2K9_SEDSS|nr:MULTISPECIES: chemotaxis protein CheW [Sediminispirochaeta]ADK82569.1 CheW protein [Sediminispirochaeta smaragdinae DSM 11293]